MDTTGAGCLEFLANSVIFGLGLALLALYSAARLAEFNVNFLLSLANAIMNGLDVFLKCVYSCFDSRVRTRTLDINSLKFSREP